MEWLDDYLESVEQQKAMDSRIRSIVEQNVLYSFLYGKCMNLEYESSIILECLLDEGFPVSESTVQTKCEIMRGDVLSEIFGETKKDFIGVDSYKELFPGAWDSPIFY